MRRMKVRGMFSRKLPWQRITVWRVSGGGFPEGGTGEDDLEMLDRNGLGNIEKHRK